MRELRRAIWFALAALALAAGLALTGTLFGQQPTPRPRPLPGRHYWRVTVDQLATGHVAHTHVAVVGRVRLVRREDDGDLHLKLTGDTAFIVAECIPALPCATPPLGVRVLVLGISRYDGEHHWWEVHPVESWSAAPALNAPSPRRRPGGSR